MNRPTLKDIAKECGVSLSTVSLVLNNNPRISAKTREAVLASVARHGYQPNAAAQNLASRKSRTISVVVPALPQVFTDIYFGQIFSGIYDEATASGYKIMLDLATPQYVEKREYVKVLRGRRADGVLSIASSVHDTYLLEFERESGAFLLVNHFFPNAKLNYIMVDYEQSARLIANHLLDLGHRRIGLLCGTNTHTGLRFRSVFLSQCVARGLSEDDVVWLDTPPGKEWDLQGGMTAAAELIARRPDLTAIACGNDRLAQGVLSYLHSIRWSVPERISVTGVDDIPDAAYTSPPLTTVRHNFYGLGRLACQRLLALYRGEISSCREILPVELVVRQSTAAPSSA